MLIQENIDSAVMILQQPGFFSSIDPWGSLLYEFMFELIVQRPTDIQGTKLKL